MIFNRDFLVDVHKSIGTDMLAMGLEPHRRRQNLISHITYGREFYTLRYWRSSDTAWLRDHLYNQSCLELLVCEGRLYIGIWFGPSNKGAKDAMRLNSIKREILDKRDMYPDFIWTDEKDAPAPTDETLVKWLYETGHETVFRKELTNYNSDEVITEMKRLKEYLDILL